MAKQDLRVELAATIGIDADNKVQVTPAPMRSNYKLQLVLMHYVEHSLHRMLRIISRKRTTSFYRVAGDRDRRRQTAGVD